MFLSVGFGDRSSTFWKTTFLGTRSYLFLISFWLGTFILVGGYRAFVMRDCVEHSAPQLFGCKHHDSFWRFLHQIGHMICCSFSWSSGKQLLHTLTAAKEERKSRGITWVSLHRLQPAILSPYLVEWKAWIRIRKNCPLKPQKGRGHQRKETKYPNDKILKELKERRVAKSTHPSLRQNQMGGKKYALIKKRGKIRKQKKKPRIAKLSLQMSKNDQGHKKAKLGGKTKIWIVKLIRIFFSLILPISLR